MTVVGAPGAIRTPDPLVRSQILYPTELRVRVSLRFVKCRESREANNIESGFCCPAFRRLFFDDCFNLLNSICI